MIMVMDSLRWNRCWKRAGGLKGVAPDAKIYAYK